MVWITMKLEITNPLFRQLEPEETEDFKKWARDNYKIGEPISGVWHPYTQLECVVMNAEGEQL